MKLLRSNRTAPSPVGDGPDDLPSNVSPSESPEPRSYGDVHPRTTPMLKSSRKSAGKLAEDNYSEGEYRIRYLCKFWTDVLNVNSR
jgi:hypothetical protein